MYYGAIKKNDVADGPGVRVTLFVSGCTHHCEGCFQPETWNFEYGNVYTDKVTDEIIEAMKPGYVAGFTLLGGEPFEPENQRVLVDGEFELAKRNLMLKFRGSENQRLIDLNKTREAGEVVLWE